MRLIDITKRAGRSLRQAKARTLLTSLAIGVGAFTITLSLAGGQGGREYADAIVSANTDVNELAVTKPVPDADAVQRYEEGGVSSGAAGPFSQGLQAITADDVDAMAAIEGVASANPNYSPAVEYITFNGDDKYQATITTFSPSVTLTYAAGGVEGDLGENEIIITEDYVEAFGFASAEDAINQQVAVVTRNVVTQQEQTFDMTIKGVSSESGLAFRAQSSLLVSNDTAKTLYDTINTGSPLYGRFLLVSVLIENADDAASIKQTLVDDGFDAQTSEDVLGVVNTFINVLLGVLLGFGALAVLTAVFGIINTQYISVLERTQQIGLMKALGMSGRDVGLLFKFEAAWIGFLGGAIGSGVAVIAGTIANPFISEALGIGDIYLLVFTPVQVAAVIIGLMVIAVGAGIFPSRKASRLDPIEALRTE